MTSLRAGDFIDLVILALLATMLTAPLFLVLYLRVVDRNQKQHAVLRNFPILGRVRYVLEAIGPELRQYFFDGDTVGRPFSRADYQSVVRAGKYLDTLISFGSKRDFEQPGWYLRNALFPNLHEDMKVRREPTFETFRYVTVSEGLFRRTERVETVPVSPWALMEEDQHVIGADLPHPWQVDGMIGMSGMSYGALGSHAIRALSLGLARVGAWMNTGEGGVSPHHLEGGGDVVFQIGPGLFGVRDETGDWSWERFREQAAIPQLRGFELKLHQGAKIRGGHVEGEKVTEEIAAIRGVPVRRTVDSPPRFRQFRDVEGLLDWVARMREEGGKPVGIKIVIGGPGMIDELADAIQRRGEGPDWITVDGSEGGSGATYSEMADSMGLPIRSAIVAVDDALRARGLRNRIKIIASGKLFSPDRIAIALALGADMVAIARGLMISVGCIQAQKCHSNECPVGVATTDPRLMKALVVEEKQHRVANYVVTLRAGLTSLAQASGIASPALFERRHAVYRDGNGRIHGADELFALPEPRPQPSFASDPGIERVEWEDPRKRTPRA